MTATTVNIGATGELVPGSTTPVTNARDGGLFVRAGLFDTLFRQAGPTLQTEAQAATGQSSDRGTKAASRLVDAIPSTQLRRADINATISDTIHDRMRQFQLRYSDAATAAAAALGTSTNTVLAFAAHETGWGRHTPGSANRESNNLFGIKARPGASAAEKVSSETTEVLAGKTLRMQQYFRRYNSAEESVADFARFLIENPRYRLALQSAGQPRAFIQAVHEAGYATDPNYAAKVISVWERLQQISEGVETPQSDWPYRTVNAQAARAAITDHTDHSGPNPLYPSMLDLFSRYHRSLEPATALQPANLAPSANRAVQ